MLVKLVAIVMAVVLMLGTAALVLAADGKQVGEYTVMVRWEQEPPVAGFLNAVVVQVARGTQPFAGAENSLTAEVRTQGAGGRTLQLRAGGTPGVYRAPLIPTDPKSYEVKLGGTLGATPVDLTFTKADGLSDPLQPSSVAYPSESLPDKAAFFDSQLVGLNGKAVAGQQDAEDARAISNEARTITVSAGVLAVFAMTVAAIAFGIASRKPPSGEARR